MAFTIPGGKEKGKALAEAQMSTLTYWAERIGNALDSGESRYPDRDKPLHAALIAEIARREGGGAQQAPQQPARTANGGNVPSPQSQQRGTALAARPVESITGTYSQPEQVMQALKDAALLAHLITPQTSCGAVPVGCGIAFAAVVIDPATETYGIPHPNADDRGLDKTALAKISAAAGVDWDPVLSCRLDDGSDPYYVHFRAVGRIRNFDGTWRTEKGEVEIDLRDDAPEAMESYKEGAKLDANGVPKELVVKRKFILRLAESKAMNRVIRRLGVRTKYKRDELQKPFIVAKIMFTGQTEDPQLKKVFAEKTFDAFHGASAALYSGSPVQAPTHAGYHPLPSAAPAPVAAPQHAPPLPGQSATDDDWSGYDDEAGALPESTTSPGQVVAGTPAGAVSASPATVPAQQSGDQPKQKELL